MTQRPDDDDLIQRVRLRVMGAIQVESPQYRTVRAGDDGWQTLAPGVERKMLWSSGSAQSCMLRLAPGTTVAAHLHLVDEECVVLEGSVRIGKDLVLRVGDFHVGREGSAHPVTSTETGALVYLRGAPDVSPAAPAGSENVRLPQ